MSNQRFRSWVEGRIAEALRVHVEARAENHPGLAGLAHESTIEILTRQHDYATLFLSDEYDLRFRFRRQLVEKLLLT